jgi:hypothetical protein
MLCCVHHAKDTGLPIYRHRSISLAVQNGRVLGIPLLLVLYWRHLNAVLSTGRDQTVSGYQMPIILLVSARLAGDDDVLAVVFDCLSREAICGVLSVGVVGILSVQCRAVVE